MSSDSVGPQYPGATEDVVEHFLGQAARKCVLLAHMKAAQKGAAIIKRDLNAVAKLRSGCHPKLLASHLVPKSAEYNDHLDLVEGRELTGQKRPAGISLQRGGLVGGRRTLHRRGDPNVVELEPVIESD
jgi:hypothetical protein